MIDLNVPVDGKTIVALLFETDRAPFVVKNPSYGIERGESISLETPWRHGTSVRSAKRSDLIKLLVPFRKRPTFEVLRVGVSAHIHESKLNWHLRTLLYVVTHDDDSLVLPFHRCQATVEIAELFQDISFGSVYIDDCGPRDGQVHPTGAYNTGSQIIINRAGMIDLHGSTSSPIPEKESEELLFSRKPRAYLWLSFGDATW